MLAGLLDAPDDNRSVQTSAGYQLRVGIPGDAIDFGRVEAPLVFWHHL